MCQEFALFSETHSYLFAFAHFPILGLFSRFTQDVCVFTITCNEIASELVDAKKRGVLVRVITDDEQVGLGVEGWFGFVCMVWVFVLMR